MKSRVLVIGATGYLGKFVTLAGPAQGHPTFALVRPSSLSSKADLIDSFKAAGVTVLQGDLEDEERLVAAIKQVDVVVSTVAFAHILDQLRIIAAIKAAGSIKRFVPSEFGNDVDRVKALEPAQSIFGEKVQVRRAIEAAGIPFTYVVSNCFSSFFLSSLLQPGLTSPPTDKVSIYGDGNVKFINVVEEDIAAYTVKALDDPRTLNKILHIRPPANILTHNQLVELWEKKIGKKLEKVTVLEEAIVKQIQETPFPENIYPAILHGVVFVGDQCNFELGLNDMEATELYPDHKYTSADEYLNQFL